MATFFQGLLSKLISAIGTAQPTLPIAQHNAVAPTVADGEAVNLQVNASGRLMVDADIAAGGALATEATLATRASEATVSLLATEATALTLATESTVSTLATETTVAAIEDTIADGCGMVARDYITCRAFSATTSESAVEPPGAGWVTVSPTLGAVEFLIVPGMTFGGTVAATRVRFRYWFRSESGARTPKFFEEILDVSQLALTGNSHAILPRRFNVQASQVYATVTFLDGTAPTITGSIDVRPIAMQARDDTTFRRDITTGNPIAQSPAYDALLDADKTADIVDKYPSQDDPLVVSEASRATGTHYAPSADGIEMGTGYKRLTIRFAFAAAGTSSVVNDIEATIDGTNWDVVTLSCIDAETGLSPTATSLDSAAGGAIAKPVMVRHADHFKKFRLKSVVTDGPTGAHTVSFRRASDKS
jgi:hypothetical protein